MLPSLIARPGCLLFVLFVPFLEALFSEFAVGGAHALQLELVQLRQVPVVVSHPALVLAKARVAGERVLHVVDGVHWLRAVLSEWEIDSIDTIDEIIKKANKSSKHGQI